MATINLQSKTPTAARRSFWQRSESTRVAYMYLLPALIIMGVITFYPLVYQIYMSFTDFGLKNIRVNSAPPTFVGLNNYTRILTNNMPFTGFNFWGTLAFDLWWAISNVVIHVVLGVLIAVLLNTEGLWGKRIYRAIYVLPVVIPALIVATVWKNLWDADYGPINTLLTTITSWFGSTQAVHIRWLDSYDLPISWIPLPLSYYAMLITNIWLGWPLNAVVATGALQSIPSELYEAAEIDGATGTQQFFNITVPMLRPAMLPFAIFGFVTTFNLFHISYFLSGGGPDHRTELLVTWAYRLVNEHQLYGVASAFAVYMFIILLVLTLITNRLAKVTASYAD
ncbi:MAG TPA: sugar ABC transporter permease [Roseiflexaceae bacterium]|nr:sugar ABC transporter permease [Roseiflexaceae bacterium]